MKKSELREMIQYEIQYQRGVTILEGLDLTPDSVLLEDFDGQSKVARRVLYIGLAMVLGGFKIPDMIDSSSFNWMVIGIISAFLGFITVVESGEMSNRAQHGYDFGGMIASAFWKLVKFAKNIKNIKVVDKTLAKDVKKAVIASPIAPMAKLAHKKMTTALDNGDTVEFKNTVNQLLTTAKGKK